MNMKMLAGAAAVAALIATPAMATQQQKVSGPQKQSADSTTGAKKMKKAQARMNVSESRMQRQQESQTGFWPADVAGNVVGGAFNTAGAIAGGALNTAGAIATAPFTPFRGDSYAYYRDSTTGRGVIADNNGPKCLPGQVTTINGQKMRCQ